VVKGFSRRPSLHSPRHTSSGFATFSPSDAEKEIEAEREKLIEREDGFGYQALTEFAENDHSS